MKLLLIALLVVQAVLAAPPSSKLNSPLQKELMVNNYADIIITMKDRTSAVLNRLTLQSFASRADRLTAVAESLQALAAASQANILQSLAEENVIVTSLWVSNQISVKGAGKSLINALASREDVSEIILNEWIPLDKPIDAHPSSRPYDARAEWGIENIEAPRAWAANHKGKGAIIATVDTGVRGTHEALNRNFVGGTHGWYDPYLKTPTPNDQNGHGTHTTGNIAGVNGVGVAPEAQWMACKGCATSSCALDALIECGQFMICPTKHDGSDRDCSKAPHVVSNSWGAGRGNTFYNDVIAAYHVAKIIVVFSIGNTGPSCSTARSPGEQNVIGVGATTNTNALAYFSSIGPSMYGNHDIKPNVAAPGNNVNSAYHTSDTAYYTMSGTSMACPHTAGVVALLVGANPDLTFEEAKRFLYAGADHNVVSTGQTCGGIKDDVFPNNSFGWGKINAYNSVMELLKSYQK